METGDCAPVAAIRRLTIHDGPGVRATVFVKGCPLHCLWCHNPESIPAHPEILFHAKLCAGCGRCFALCPAHCRTETGEHAIDKSRCTLCGRCVEHCLHNALSLCGRTMTAAEVFPIVMRDAAFYADGGGATVSGGEPLLYPGFVSALFAALKAAGVSTALDTCGAVSFSAFETVRPRTDLVLYDLKGMDSDRHKINTGCGNDLIHSNLLELGKRRIPVEIRMPIVPGFNDSDAEFEAAAQLLRRVPSLRCVRLLAYHSMARSKYAACGRSDPMPHVDPPSPQSLAHIAEIFRSALPGIAIFTP